MRKFFKFFILCSPIILFTGCANDLAKSNSFQSKLAHDDILFITKALLENHPGPKNLQDPEFMNILNSAHQKALIDIENVSTETEHIELLKKYTSSFNDKHLAVFTKHKKKDINQQLAKKVDFSIREFMPCTTWVTLSSFGPRSQNQIKKLNDIIFQLSQCRNDRLIIFDVRGNGGGTSSWGTKIIKALFGEAYAEKKINKLYKDVYADWRVSKDNAKHMRKIADTFKKQFGEKSNEARWAAKVYNGMTHAFKKGVFFYSERDNAESSCDDTEKICKNMCFAKILVLIDKFCFSACLSFLDQLKSLDCEVLFVGQTTNADTFYMDVRRVELPSKLGQLQFPLKVSRNQRRASNQPYHPNVVYDGDFNDTQKVEQWLRSHVILRVYK